MSKTPLTEKQQQVYNVLVKQISSGFPPSVREICSATGIKSTSTVHAILNALEEEGYIIRDAKNSRSIRLDMGCDSQWCPWLAESPQANPF